MPKMTKAEKAFLKQARGPGEECYHVKLDLKFLAKPGLSFKDVTAAVFERVRGDMGGLTMPTKRVTTYMDISLVDL